MTKEQHFWGNMKREREREKGNPASVKIHVGFDVLRLCAFGARVFGAGLLGLVSLLPVDWSILLWGLVVLGRLHFWLGFGQN